MKDTELVFILGSGRSGTRMMKSLLSGPGVEARHEYVRNAYQMYPVLWYTERITWHEMSAKLKEVYEPARFYSAEPLFVDATHKLSWCADVLTQTFPKAKYVQLVRDGRKVVSSFFHKLRIFDERAYNIYLEWVRDPSLPRPPLEEKFWFPTAPAGYDTFQRICWHWASSNLYIQAALTEHKLASGGECAFIRLEDLREEAGMHRFLKFLGIEYDASFLEAMQKPKHVYVPVDYKLTEEEEEVFRDICGPLMKQYGYDIEKGAYRVEYQM